MEFNGLSDRESVELKEQKLRISKRAKQILEFMKKMAKSQEGVDGVP
jgi:hypothetical protein